MLNISKGQIWSRISGCGEFISYYKVIEVFDREVALKACDQTGWEHPNEPLRYPSLDTFTSEYKLEAEKADA